MKNLIYILILVVRFSAGCGLFQSEVFIGSVWESYEPIADTLKSVVIECADRYGYETSNEYPEHHPMRYINLSFYFLGDTARKFTFSDEAGRAYVRNLLNPANDRLEENRPMYLPIGNNTPVLPIGFRYRLAKDAHTADGNAIYFHDDEELAFYVKEGKHRNVFDRKMIEKYPCPNDNTLRIFVLPHHPDSVASPTYTPTSTGVAFLRDNALKMAGSYERSKMSAVMASGDTFYHDAWTYVGLLNHEVGHLLGLPHSWLLNDGCDDTVPHPNCWSHGDPPCDSLVSNNVMDYNTFKTAWTPCQISRIHHRMADKNSTIRKALEPVWCHYKHDQAIYIQDTVYWYSAKDLESDVIVVDGGHLEISCRISFPHEAGIYVHAGATLVLHAGARLENDCEEAWAGIFIAKVGKREGEVIMFSGAEVLNVVDME